MEEKETGVDLIQIRMQRIDDTKKKPFNLACVGFQPLNETVPIGRDVKILFRLLFLPSH